MLRRGYELKNEWSGLEKRVTTNVADDLLLLRAFHGDVELWVVPRRSLSAGRASQQEPSLPLLVFGQSTINRYDPVVGCGAQLAV